MTEDASASPVPAQGIGSLEETEQEWIARTVAELGPLSEWERERLALLLLVPGR